VRRVCGLGLERFCDNLLDPIIADFARRSASGLIAQFSPSAARRTISARCASARAILRRRTYRLSSARSSTLSSILLDFRPAIIAPESLIQNMESRRRLTG
jgi:hypothetical protein